MTPPRVSVVVPTFDRADLLPRAVDSALAQTMADLEVVIVDDASTDDTSAVVTGYDDDRVRYLAHGKNRGGSAARNTGIERARGEYVAFLDSDDEWRPEKLARQLDRLDAEGDGWIGAYCDHEIRPGGRTGPLQRAVASLLATDDPGQRTEGGEALIAESLANNVNSGAGSTLLVRTDVARRVGGFDESLARFQDPDFLIRVLREGKVAHVDDTLVIRHGTGAPPADALCEASEQFLEKFADEVADAERAGHEVRAGHCLLLAKRYFEEGQFVLGAALARRAAIRTRQYPGLGWSVATGVYALAAGAAASVGASSGRIRSRS